MASAELPPADDQSASPFAVTISIGTASCFASELSRDAHAVHVERVCMKFPRHRTDRDAPNPFGALGHLVRRDPNGNATSVALGIRTRNVIRRSAPPATPHAEQEAAPTRASNIRSVTCIPE